MFLYSSPLRWRCGKFVCQSGSHRAWGGTLQLGRSNSRRQLWSSSQVWYRDSLDSHHSRIAGRRSHVLNLRKIIIIRSELRHLSSISIPDRVLGIMWFNLFECNLFSAPISPFVNFKHYSKNQSRGQPMLRNESRTFSSDFSPDFDEQSCVNRNCSDKRSFY